MNYARWDAAFRRSDMPTVHARLMRELEHPRNNTRRRVFKVLDAIERRTRWWEWLNTQVALLGGRLVMRLVVCSQCGLDFLLDRWNVPPGGTGAWAFTCHYCRPAWVGQHPDAVRIMNITPREPTFDEIVGTRDGIERGPSMPFEADTMSHEDPQGGATP